MWRLSSSLLLSLLIASSASAVTMDWTPIGNPGNPADVSGFGTPIGAVGHGYFMGTYEVTNAQYAEFLNAKAASDPLNLYSGNMANPSFPGGIIRTGSSGSYTYSVVAGRENMPVNWVTVYDAARFANWLHNGQGDGDTETGSYTIGPSFITLTRNANATIVLPNFNEWHKAAYYDAGSASYFDYPTASNIQTTCTSPGATPNTANCGGVVGGTTVVGSYTGSASAYGTFDQGGNVAEWIENGSQEAHSFGKGAYLFSSSYFAAGEPFFHDRPQSEDPSIGFRLVMIPEPSTGVLVIAGLLGLAWRRRGLA